MALGADWKGSGPGHEDGSRQRFKGMVLVTKTTSRALFSEFRHRGTPVRFAGWIGAIPRRIEAETHGLGSISRSSAHAHQTSRGNDL